MNDIWFISDTHFGHTNIIKYDKRPFASITEHDEALIENWNALVKRGDLVYHLGDFAFYKSVEQVERVLSVLNGQIHHVYGNHDRQQVNAAKGWASQQHYKEIKVNIGEPRKKKIVLCHYPFMTWNAAHHGSWHLHGHCHGNLQPSSTTRIDVGVPCWNYRPVSLDQIVEEMKNRKYVVVDQHTSDRRPSEDDTKTPEEQGQI